MAVVEEQEDVGAESDLGVGILAVSVKQRLALPGVTQRLDQGAARIAADLSIALAAARMPLKTAL